MKRALLAISCCAAVIAAGPLGAQSQSPGADTQSPRAAVTPSVPESRTSPGAIAEGERVTSPWARTIDEPADRPGGRISETAPAPRAASGESRFRADLASCTALEAESRLNCRREMYAARAQGLYRN